MFCTLRIVCTQCLKTLFVSIPKLRLNCVTILRPKFMDEFLSSGFERGISSVTERLVKELWLGYRQAALYRKINLHIWISI